MASAVCTTIGIAASVVASRHALAIVGGMILVGAIGWADDRRGVAPWLRLAVHTVAAAGALVLLGGLPAFRLGASAVPLGAAGYLLGTLGIVWSINLFNFMDGIDGFAGSQSVLIFGTVGTICVARGDSSLGTIAWVIALASAGFVVWNWPPAKIFMGDVGSGAIGYAAAVLAIASENAGSMPLVAIAVVGGLFIGDATVTLVRRIRRGDRLSEAHRDHAYQRLAQAWVSHRRVTLGAALVTALLALPAAVGSFFPGLLLPALFAGGLVVAGVLAAADRIAP